MNKLILITLVQSSLWISISSFILTLPKKSSKQQQQWLSSGFIEYVDDADEIEEEDFMLETIKNSPWKVTADMKYTEYNVNRQRDNYRAIRSAGGKDATTDIYVREPASEIFWFAGKVAHCTGTVSLEKAVCQQWNIIEQHACRIRPIELGRKVGFIIVLS